MDCKILNMFLIYQFGEPTSDVIEPADSNKQVSDKKVEEKTSAVPAELVDNLHAARLPSGEILLISLYFFIIRKLINKWLQNTGML